MTTAAAATKVADAEPHPAVHGRAESSVTLSIIIVAWNAGPRVTTCLRTICASPPDLSYEIIVVDNASADGTAATVRESFPDVRVIQNRRNEGFQKANNRALRIARGDYIVLLNPDTEVADGVFDRTVAFLAATPDVGALSPRCVYGDGRLQWSVGIFPSLSVLWAWCCARHPVLLRLGAKPCPIPPVDSGRSQEQDYAYGAFFAIRRQALIAAGPMDERFFLAGGDVAWSCEIRRRGWRIWYLADVTVIHHESTSRARVPYKSALDWIAAHRRLLYKYEGVRAGLQGEALFAVHLALVAAAAGRDLMIRAAARLRPIRKRCDHA